MKYGTHYGSLDMKAYRLAGEQGFWVIRSTKNSMREAFNPHSGKTRIVHHLALAEITENEEIVLKNKGEK